MDIIPPTHHTNREKVGVNFLFESSHMSQQGFGHRTHSSPLAHEGPRQDQSLPVVYWKAMSGSEIHPIDIEMLGTLVEGGQGNGKSQEIHDREYYSCKDVGNTCRRTRMDFLYFVCSFVITAMLDRRGFVCLLSLLDFICFNDLFYLYVPGWDRTFCHVLFNVIMT